MITSPFMMRFKKIMRWVRYLSLTLVSFFVAFYLIVAIALNIYQERLAQIFATAINKKLTSPIKISQVSFSAIRYFPNVSVALIGVSVQGIDSLANPLLSLDKVSFTFRPYDLIRGKYSVRAVILENGTLQLHQDINGKANFKILQPNAFIKADKSLQLDWSDVQVRLFDIKLIYQNLYSKTSLGFSFQKTFLSLKKKPQQKITDIYLTGNFQIEELSFRRYTAHNTFFKNQKAKPNLHIVWDLQQHRFDVQANSKLIVNECPLFLGGSLDLSNDQLLNLIVTADHLDLIKGLGFLPARIKQIANQYQMTQGYAKVLFNLHTNLRIGIKPKIYVQFSSGEAITLQHKQTKQTLQKIKFKGYFTNGDPPDRSHNLLEIQYFRAQLGQQVVDLSLRLEDFTNPLLQLKVNGRVNLAEALAFYPLENLEKLSGNANMKFEVQGRIRQILQTTSDSSLKATGYFTIEDAYIKAKPLSVAISHGSGSFHFDDSQIKTENASFSVGENQFYVRGTFPRLLHFLLNAQNKFRLEGDVRCKSLDIASLAKNRKKAAPSKNKQPYRLSVHPYVTMHIQATVDQLFFDCFEAQKVYLDFTLEDEQFTIKTLKMNAFEGNLELQSFLDFKSEDSIRFTMDAQLKKINLYRFFGGMNNFSQQFVRAENIEGLLDADIQLNSVMQSDLEFIEPYFFAKAYIYIHSGSLVRFAPLVKVGQAFFKNRNYQQVHFKEVKNTFRIERDKFIIPKMEINSDLLSFFVEGNYSWRDSIAIRLEIPLDNFKKQAGGSLPTLAQKKAQKSGIFSIFLGGTSKNPEISFDIDFQLMDSKKIIALENKVKQINQKLTQMGAATQATAE